MKLKKLYSFLTLLTAFLWLGSGSVWGTQLNEGFDLFLPDGWSTIHVSGANSWGRSSVYGHNELGSANIAYASAGHENYLITPMVKPESGEKLHFWISAQQWSGTTIKIDVTTDKANFTTIATYATGSSLGTTSLSSWVEKVVDLNDYVGTPIYIAFHVIDANGSGICIDDVSGVTIFVPSCPDPTLTLDSKSETSATFSWTEGGTEPQWQYLCLPASTTLTPEHWNSATTTTSKSVTINGLYALSSYIFYLRADCGGDDYSMVVREEFTTECSGDPITIPAGGWTYGFEDTSFPACFSTIRTGSNFYLPDITTGAPYSGNRSAHFYGSGSTNNTILVLPKFNVDIKNLKLSFYYQNGSTYTSRPGFKVGYVTDPTKANTFTALTSDFITRKTAYATIPAPYVLDDFSGAPEGAYIAICYTGGSTDSHSYLDDIKVESKQDCSAPQNVALSGSSISTADFSWDANTGVDSYKYCVVAQGEEADWSGDLSVNTNSVHVESLTPGNYTFYVKCGCGTAAASLDFEIVSCPTVTGVTLSNQVWNGVTVNWTTSATTNCDVQYKAAGDADWTSAATNTDATSKVITGLSVGTTYSFQVKPNCSADGWVAAGETYEPSCPTPGALTLSNQTYNGVTVSWDEIVGVGTWNLEYQQGDLGWVPVTANPLSTTTYTFSDLVTDVEYSFRVQAGCEGAWSPIATYAPEYAAPTDVLVSVQDLGGDASWAPVTGATGYQYIVVLKDAAQDWSSPATGTTISSGYVHADPVLSGLHAKTAYDFYVKAVFAGGTSAATKKSFTTSSHAPNTPTVADGDITSSSAVATWTLPSACQATQCQWICKLTSAGTPADDDAAWSAPTTEFTANISGLDAYTDYTVYVRAYYEDGIYSSNASKTFKTKCGVETLEYSETFGTSSGTKPGCWTIANWGTSGNQWTTASDYAHSGVALKYNAKTFNSTSAISPSIYIAEKCTLCFYVRNAVGSGSYFIECQVFINDGISDTDITNLTTNVSGTTSSVNTRHTTATAKYYDMSSFVGKTITIRFLGKGYDSSTTSALWIDDVSLSYKPISAPTSLAAEATADGAVVTWVDDAEVGPWDLQYRVNGSSEAWTAVNGIATKTKTLTGLTLGTEYEVQVRAHASEHRISSWTASQTFIPAVCPAVETVTLSAKTYNSVTVNWTTASATNCDVQYQAEGAAAWTSAATDLEATSKNIIGLSVGTKYYFQVKPNCSADGWAAAGETYTPAYGIPAPVVSGEAETQATVAWDAVVGATAYQYMVVAKDGDHSDWTGATDTDELSATLTGLTGGSNYDVWVRSNYSGNYSAEAKATFTTTKVAPTTLVKDAATTESITFSWSYTGAVNQFQWKTSKAGSEWSAVQSEKSATATGLEAGTTYTIYVRNYYADGIYSDVLSGSFNTECGSKAIGYYENFDAASALPACWESTNFGSGNNQWNIGMSWYECKSSWNSARFLAYKNSGSATSDLITPAIELTEPTMLKFFYVKNSTDVVAQVLIRISGEEDAVIGTLATKSSWAATADSLDLTPYVGQTAKIIFRAYGSTSNTTRYFYLDDVSFAYKYCAKPTNLAASATTDGAVVTWDDTELGPWRLRYRTNGVGDWTTINNIASKTYTIEGLIEQEYEVQVRTYCSTHRYSAWTASETFTPQCPNVTGVTFADETYNSVTVNWTADGEATWSLRYKTDGDWTTINNIDTKTYGLTGLTTGETYTVAVKASCKGDEGWVAAATTYTPQYGVPTNVTISDIKDVTATLAWDAAAGATGYQYIVLEGDVAADWTAPQSTTELTVDLSNLGAATTYSVYVRAAYGLNFGDATAKEIFATITYAPTNLAETAHDETSASFSWNHNAEGAATRYEYVALEGTDTPTGSTAWTLLDNNVTAATVDGLNTGAAYTFYVRSVYTNDAKSDYASLAFSTECAVRNMPFNEDFEAGVSPLCWSAMNGTVDYYDYSGNNGWQVVNDGGNYVMRYKSHSSAATLTPLTMPQINVTAKALLSFKSLNNYSNKTVAAKVIISAAGEENYEVALVTSNALKEQYIAIPDNFTGKVVTIKFQATANVNGGRIDLDDVRVVRGEVFADAADNSARLATLKTAGETMDVVVERTIFCDGDYNTICLPFDLPTLDGTPLAGGELWSFRYGYVENGELLMRIAPASSIEAGVPYLLTITAGDNIVSPIFTNVTITKSAGVEVGQTDDAKFVGILKPEAFSTTGDDVHKKLFVLAGDQLAWADVANNLKSFRAYFRTAENVDGTPVSNHMPARIVRGEQTATGIDDVHGDGQSLKILENGCVVIIRNGVKYSVHGQVISK